VAKFKLIPHAADRLEAQVVHDERWRDALAAAVVSGLQQPMGDDVRIELRLVDKFSAERSGKPRYFI
jgi:hypothetical protein